MLQSPLRRLFVLGLSPQLGGCAGIQSALDPQGPVASEVAALWWVMFWGGWAVFALVFGLFLYALFGRRRPALDGDLLIPSLGIAFPVAVLSALMVYAFALGERITRNQAPADLVVEVVGQRWWWEIRYPGAGAGPPLITANEIHIPAGRQIEFAVMTRDVIHSFWVPNLGGKIDLIPGRVNRIRLAADRPGIFRGQCAEFCGAQHARMAFFVVAHPPEQFEAWLQAQRRPSRVPGDELLRFGRTVFMANDCVDCHSIRGTRARGEGGPDLTHLGSRRSIAAGTLPNGRASLMAWIRASQSTKPGNDMPDFPELTDPELHALAAYLEGLQ